MERHDLHGCSQSQCVYSLVEACQIANVSKMPLICWCLDNFFDQLNGICLNVNICSVFVQYCLYFLYFPLAKSLIETCEKIEIHPIFKETQLLYYFSMCLVCLFSYMGKAFKKGYIFFP